MKKKQESVRKRLRQDAVDYKIQSKRFRMILQKTMRKRRNLCLEKGRLQRTIATIEKPKSKQI